MTARADEAAEVGPPLWLACLAPAVVSAAVRGLWAPDEPRYAQAAREIYEGGDFLVMHLCGSLYPDKPPLLFWLAGLLGWISDWNVAAMRLVSLGATAATALAVARLARRWWGPAEARLAPAILLTTAMLLEIGGRLQIDPLLTALCTGALVLADGAASDPGSARRRLAAAGLLTGLGALAKGPVAFANVGLVLAAWRWCAGRRGPLSRGGWIAAAALALLPVLAWAVAASLKEPALREELFWGQHMNRVVGDDPPHDAPVWKHALRMPLYLLPWTLPVLLGAASVWRAWRQRRAGSAFDEGLLRAGAWVAVLFVFYSLIPPKRDLYLLPAYPAAALIAARWLAHAGGAAARRAAGLVAAAAALALGAALCAVPFAGDGTVEGIELGWRAVAAGAALALGACFVAWSAARSGAWVRAFLVSWVLGITLGFGLLLPAIDPAKSAESVARVLAERPERPTAIPCLGVQAEGYRFYGGGPVVRDRDLERALAREGEEFLALVRRKEWERLPEELRGRMRVIAERRVGSRSVLVVGKG